DTGGSGVNVAGIVLQLDGAAVARTIDLVTADKANVAFTPSADLAEGIHSFTVLASDLAGNAAAPATSVFLIDRTPPTFAILTPANGSTSTTPTPPLTAQATDTGGSGVDLLSLVLRLDGAPVAASVSPVGPNLANLSFTPTV